MLSVYNAVKMCHIMLHLTPTEGTELMKFVLVVGVQHQEQGLVHYRHSVSYLNE